MTISGRNVHGSCKNREPLSILLTAPELQIQSCRSLLRLLRNAKLRELQIANKMVEMVPFNCEQNGGCGKIKFEFNHRIKTESGFPEVRPESCKIHHDQRAIKKFFGTDTVKMVAI